LNDISELLMERGFVETAVKVLLLVAHHPLSTDAQQARAKRLLEPYLVSYAGLADYPLERAIDDARAALGRLSSGEPATTDESGVDWSARDLMELLSEREREVLRLLAQALSNQEIADELVVGVSTVKKHINHIYNKLGINNRIQALNVAR